MKTNLKETCKVLTLKDIKNAIKILKKNRYSRMTEHSPFVNYMKMHPEQLKGLKFVIDIK